VKEDALIKFELLRDRAILIVSPRGTIEAGDFAKIAKVIDPYIVENGSLTGLLIEAPSFPGWDSFGALVEHLKFVRDHHKKIERVAAVTDSAFLQIAPRLAEHFAHPEIRVFGSLERARALSWLQTG
jgi:hypothetical protein